MTRPAILIAALAALIFLAHGMAYRDEVAAGIRYVEKPFTLCRLPDLDSEYRLIIQHRIGTGRLIEECVVAPRNPEESPAKTMQRLLRRKQNV